MIAVCGSRFGTEILSLVSLEGLFLSCPVHKLQVDFLKLQALVT